MGRVRHSRLLIPHKQPLRPAPALLAREPPPDVLAQDVTSVRVRQRLVVQRDAPVARLTERPESERLVISQGAEDDASSARRWLAVGGHSGHVRSRPRTALIGPVKTLTA